MAWEYPPSFSRRRGGILLKKKNGGEAELFERGRERKGWVSRGCLVLRAEKLSSLREQKVEDCDSVDSAEKAGSWLLGFRLP